MEEKLIFEAFPESPLVVVRVKNVKNAASVREAIVGKTIAHDAAFIDAQTIPDIFLVHLAAFKALAAEVRLLHFIHLRVSGCDRRAPGAAMIA